MKGKKIPLHHVQCQHRKICGVCNFFSAKILELAEYPAEKQTKNQQPPTILLFAGVSRRISVKECNVTEKKYDAFPALKETLSCSQLSIYFHNSYW